MDTGKLLVMDIKAIADLANLGAIPMLTFAVVVLWRRLNAVQDDFLAYLKDRAQAGDDAAQNRLAARAANGKPNPS
jgi:hypothetical protein